MTLLLIPILAVLTLKKRDISEREKNSFIIKSFLASLMQIHKVPPVSSGVNLCSSPLVGKALLTGR